MKCRCPACGAVMSLDVFIDHEDALLALVAVFELSKPLGKALIAYFALFRPQNSSLSFKRVLSLLNELMPMIEAQKFERNKRQYEAPLEAWLYGIEITLNQREELDLPMRSHGYLLKVMTGWKSATNLSEITPSLANNPSVPTTSKKKATINRLQAKKKGK